MIRHSKTLTLGGSALLAFLLLNGINMHSAMANDQTPNYQILSSNTSTDSGSWIRWSVTTYQPFHVTLSSTNVYSYQMNTYVNGCGNGDSGCSYSTWWLQSIVYAQTQNDANGAGAWVNDAFNVVFEGQCNPSCTNSPHFCTPSFSNEINVNKTGYPVLQEAWLNDTTHMSYLLSISNNLGTSLYSQFVNDCSYPTFGGTFGPIKFFSQEEGVVVCSSLCSASFSPLSSTIFSPFYLDMVSNYNDMSDSSKGTQTGETSNLYQSAGQAFGESYGSMYLYTIIGSEITKTDSCPC